MEHHLLNPLYSIILTERPQDPVDLSATNLVALRLLTGPYLDRAYASWGLAQAAPGRWILCQDWGDKEIITRDVFEPFYPHYYGYDEDDAPQDHYEVDPPRIQDTIKHLTQGEDHVSDTIRARADQVMDRLREANPDYVDRLLNPTPEQLARRQDIRIETIEEGELTERLRPIIGDLADWSLKSHGIKYHNPAYHTRDDLFLLAHNGEEVCGLMKLNGSRQWGYGVSFVSVSPGFRNQGLSSRLYQAAIDRCIRDGRVLIRSTPGDGTPAGATLAYDRMVRQSPVLHTSSHGPLHYGLQVACEKGWPYATLVDRLKHACDDALPSPDKRVNEPGRDLDWEAVEQIRQRHAAVFDALTREGPATPRPRKMGLG